jgi:hypothetical protein
MNIFSTNETHLLFVALVPAALLLFAFAFAALLLLVTLVLVALVILRRWREEE